MTIHLYALCWNERRILPQFFAHYDQFVDEYVIFDDSSDDGSTELLDAHPKVQWAPYSVEGDSFLLHATTLYNEMWKQSRGRADWVIICNIDEMIVHPDLVGVLEKHRQSGITIERCVGYEMVSLRLPHSRGSLAESIRRGAPSEQLSKPCVFRPDEIEEINFTPGRHLAEPSGNVVWSDPSPIELRHFKYLGYWHLRRRIHELRASLRPEERWLYPQSDRQILRRYLFRLRQSRRLPSVTNAQRWGR
jgi:hypothetical protein